MTGTRRAGACCPGSPAQSSAFDMPGWCIHELEDLSVYMCLCPGRMQQRMARATVALAIAATVDAFVPHRMFANSAPELKVKQVIACRCSSAPV